MLQNPVNISQTIHHQIFSAINWFIISFIFHKTWIHPIKFHTCIRCISKIKPKKSNNIYWKNKVSMDHFWEPHILRGYLHGVERRGEERLGKKWILSFRCSTCNFLSSMGMKWKGPLIFLLKSWEIWVKERRTVSREKPHISGSSQISPMFPTPAESPNFFKKYNYPGWQLTANSNYSWVSHRNAFSVDQLFNQTIRELNQISHNVFWTEFKCIC